jgi:hypothetical protein
MPQRREPVNNPLASRLNGAMGAAMDEMLNDMPAETVIQVPGLVIADDGTIPAHGFQITRKGLMRYPEATREHWEQVGTALLMMRDALQWLIGDWLLFGHRVYGVTYEQAGAMLGRDIGTLYNWVSVCQSVDFSRRREKLSFSHHVEVAKLTAEQQTYWLEQAELGGWAVARLRRSIRAAMEQPILEKRGGGIGDDLRWLLRHGKWVQDDRRRNAIRERIGRLRAWLDELEGTLGAER